MTRDDFDETISGVDTCLSTASAATDEMQSLVGDMNVVNTKADELMAAITAIAEGVNDDVR